jgi:hypothetical protein
VTDDGDNAVRPEEEIPWQTVDGTCGNLDLKLLHAISTSSRFAIVAIGSSVSHLMIVGKAQST